MPQEKLIIKELFKNNSQVSIKQGLRDENIETIERKQRQKRLNIYHFIVHSLAIVIIFFYILMILLGINIPREFSTIVSIIIGFYFARSFFEFS